MELKELREQWEKGGEVTLCVATHYNTVYVVLERDEKYSLYRYFKIGDQWMVSADVIMGVLKDCLSRVTNAFEELINC